MSISFLVWRLYDGYANAATFWAHSHLEAAASAHQHAFEHDFEYDWPVDDADTLCVQRNDGNGDRKVRVIHVRRALVPDYRTSQVSRSDMLARCTVCRVRLFDSGGWRGLCRRCRMRRAAVEGCCG